MEVPSPIEVGLKAKGIGPKGLRPIERETLEGIINQLTNGEVSEELVGAFLMGFRVLEKDQDQLLLLEDVLRANSSYLSPSLLSVSAKIGEGSPEGPWVWVSDLKKGVELSSEVCRQIVDFLIDPDEDAVVKAALLQGLRVKRETDNENAALYGRLMEICPVHQSNFPLIVDISEPYDGMSRNDNLSLELGVVLSLAGVKVVLHGVKNLGPKYGKGILSRVDESIACNYALAQSSLKEVGLAILDQRHVWPEFHSLLQLRNRIKKRPFLATVEKMLMPLRGEKNLLVTGYVHRAYRESIPAMLRSNGIDSYLLFKGLEGGVQLRGGGECTVYFEGGGSLRHENFFVDKDGEEVSWSEDSGILGTAEAILKFGLGSSGGDRRITDMKSMMVDGRFREKLAQIRKFYPEPNVG